MSLSTGSRVGSYEISGALGAGGMGEVFRARDTKLNREVAIKVLPEAFAEDRDRVARFRREAQLVAALNHPNVAAIYGLEETNGMVALALELVDGEDLQARLARGPIPVDEAIAIAKQIAEGLEAAHEKGIVHRDLKPANVKVTKDGIVKILDFGLAKAWDAEPGSGDSGLSQSPTMSRHMTEAGMILGTAAYMSPEQARGRAVDRRSDVWSFGVVLFEMLTGRRLFAGETVTDVLAAVLTREPDLSALPSTVPPRVRRLLARCLDRDVRRRLQAIGEARIALESGAGDEESTRPAARPAARLPWAVAAVAAAAAALLALKGRPSATPDSPVESFDVSYPAGVEPIGTLVGGVAVSPDGRSLALIGVKNGPRRLFLRRLDGTDAVEIPGTSGVNTVTFSPDGASLGYVLSNTDVVRFSISDGQKAVAATGADVAGSMAWGDSGIVYPKDAALWLAPAGGGAAHALTALDEKRRELWHLDPEVLPGGRTILFTSLADEPGSERIEAVDADGRRRHVVVERAATPILSPTGHLLFAREGFIYAVPFDAPSATAKGAAVAVLPQGVVGNAMSGTAAMRLSASGTLVYLPQGFASTRVVSVGRDGAARALPFGRGVYRTPRVSPDGKRLLVESSGSSLEVLDLARETRTRLVASANGTNFPVWTSDGARVVYRRFNATFWAASDGSGAVGRIPGASNNDYPHGTGADPDSVLMLRIRPETSGDIVDVSISGTREPRPLVAGRAYEGGPQLSPDRKWMLWASDVTGQLEIYVAARPALERPAQVSEGGGTQPRWAPSGREIFYRSNGRMFSVPFEGSGSSPVLGKPAPLFEDEYTFGFGLTAANYDVTPDGRFVMLRQDPYGTMVRVVARWTSVLRETLEKGGLK